jgi:hypothetical protein
MFMKRKQFNAIIENTQRLEKQLGVVLSDIAQYYPADYRRDNPYRTKAAQVAAILQKYQGTAEFGNQILPRVVNLRVAFSIPNRLLLAPSPKAEKASKTAVKSAQDFLNEFMSLNLLDSSLPRDLAKESEFHGQVLIRLKWDNAEKLPRAFYYPWKETGYKIETANKYQVDSPIKCIYQSEHEETTIQDREFAFIAFNDRLNENIGYPTSGGILRDIENVDKDLRDWRKLNHLFAHPTPHFKCETVEQAKAINTMISGVGWKVGTAIATNAEFALKGPTGAESNLLMMAIQTGAKVISAHTGIGIHFLGFANVMSNRATADSMGEPTEVVLHSEISSWKAFYLDLFKKAIDMRNMKLNKKIEQGLIEPRLVPLTDRQWRHIKDIYMLAAKDNLLSHRTFLENMPGIDVEAEMSRLEEEAAKREENGEENPEEQDSSSSDKPGENNRESNENDV